MILWESIAWVVGGAAVGTPISAAMGTLPEKNIRGGISLRDAQENARDLTDWRVGELLRDVLGTGRRSRRRSSSDDGDVLGLYGLGVVAATALYAQHAVAISGILFWLSVLCLAVTTSVFGVLYFRRTFDGHATGWMLVGTVVFAGVGSVVAYWLIEPPLHGALADALASIEIYGIGGVLPYLVPLLHQLVAAIAAFAVLLASIALCVANMSAVLMAVGAWGSGLWSSLFWLTRWATRIASVIVMAVLAVVALALASGLVTDWVTPHIPAVHLWR